MSRGIILYQSKYGATKKYADWLVEETGYDCIETKNAKVVNVQNYDVIILGGGVYASGIAGLQFLKKNIGQLTDKKIAVFAVGASPYDEKAIMQIREMHFKDALSNIPLFYCRGSWDEEKMKFGDRTLCKMLQKAVAKQNSDEYEPWQKALMCAVGQKCDCIFNMGYDYNYSNIKWWISKIRAHLAWSISTPIKWNYFKCLYFGCCLFISA